MTRLRPIVLLAAFPLLAAQVREARAATCDSNIMIVLDRSCSMNNPVSADDDRTKWEIATAAIAELTGRYADDLRFGLIMFPDETGDKCVQDGPIYVETGPGTAGAVQQVVGAAVADGPCVTNIDTALAQVASDPAFAPQPDQPERRGFVLLLTDGAQSKPCGGVAEGDPRILSTIEELYDAGYPTYVIGFGGAVRADSLEQFAQAGGVARSQSPSYFQADDEAQLQAALTEIVGTIVSDPEFGGCTGTPCPDGRCFGGQQMCVDGTCHLALPDAGPTPDAGAAPDAGRDPAADGEAAGCGCRAGGSGAGALFAAMLLLVATRRRRPGWSTMRG